MKYISIDIETTGRNPDAHDILEFGAIIEDSSVLLPREQCPTFHAYIWKEEYRGEPYALAMNAKILQKIVDFKIVGNPLLMSELEFGINFKEFLYSNTSLPLQWNDAKPWIVAGKNISGFDIPFLKRMPIWSGIKTHRRTLDPTMFFLRWDDEVPPDLSTCKRRAGLSEQVTHEALDDAWDVISLLRTQYPIK